MMAWSMSSNLEDCITTVIISLLSSDSSAGCSSTDWQKMDVSLTYGSGSSTVITADTNDSSSQVGADGTIIVKSNLTLTEDDMTITDIKIYSEEDSSGVYELALENSGLDVVLNNDSGDVLYIEIEVDITNSLE